MNFKGNEDYSRYQEKDGLYGKINFITITKSFKNEKKVNI